MTHGWAHCRDGQCLCDAGHCSTDGVTCVAEEGEDKFSFESLLVQDEGAPIWVFVAFVVVGVMATLVSVFALRRRRQRGQLAEQLLPEH